MDRVLLPKVAIKQRHPKKAKQRLDFILLQNKPRIRHVVGEDDLKWVSN